MSPEEIKKQKQVIIKNIGFNSLLIVIVLIYSVIFLSPGFDELSVKIAGAQQFFDRIQKLTINGTDIEDLNSMLATTTAQNAKTSLQKILSKPESKIAVSEIIKKEDGFTGSYVAWLNEKVEKLSELQKQGYYYNKILGEIIPTFTNVAASSELLSLKSAESNQKTVVTNRIELTEFVKFFEEDLLKKYKITSSSKIGIGSVEFKSVKGTAGSTIGSFTLPIDIEGDNTNILAFIRGIQSSGRFPSNFFEPKSSEFWKSISLSNSELSSLSNLLVSIDSLSLDNLPTENLAATNKGTITLRFYVK